MARCSGAVDEDSEDTEKMEADVQRKRLAVPGRMVYFPGGEGNAADGAWVGSIPADGFAELQPCTSAGSCGDSDPKRSRGSCF